MTFFSNPHERTLFLDDLAHAYEQPTRELFYFHINSIRKDYDVGWDDIYLAAVGMGLSRKVGDAANQSELDLD